MEDLQTRKMMDKINLGKVHNDFGDVLPASADEFFHDGKNEVTREQLSERYNIRSNYRAYEAFKVEFAEFVAGLKKAAKANKDEAK